MWDEVWLLQRTDEELETLLNDVRTVQKWHRRHQAWGIAWSYGDMSSQIVSVMVDRMRWVHEEWPEQLRLPCDEMSIGLGEVDGSEESD